MARPLELPKGGFNFDNYQRNVMLAENGLKLPTPTKTGTTIVGLKFKDGVVLAADTRATSGTTVADKNCEKTRALTDNIYTCGAGTAADTEYVVDMIASQLILQELATGRQAQTVTAVAKFRQMLFRYGGHIGCAMIIGGYDLDGPQLYMVYPHGSTADMPFTTMGSGCYASMGVLESRWVKNMERDEAIALAKDAILAGIFHDLASGSNVDLVVLQKGKTETLRNCVKPNERSQKEQSYKYQRGRTSVIKESIRDLVTITEHVEAMAID